MERVLQQAQCVMGVGKDVRLSAQFAAGGLSKAGQDLLIQKQEPLLNQGQAGRQGERRFVAGGGVEALQSLPGRARQVAMACAVLHIGLLVRCLSPPPTAPGCTTSSPARAGPWSW